MVRAWKDEGVNDVGEAARIRTMSSSTLGAAEQQAARHRSSGCF